MVNCPLSCMKSMITCLFQPRRDLRGSICRMMFGMSSDFPSEDKEGAECQKKSVIVHYAVSNAAKARMKINLRVVNMVCCTPWLPGLGLFSSPHPSPCCIRES